MSTFTRLETWYTRQCDGDWEHTYTVNIGTLDNPGWFVDIDLVGTALETVEFAPIERNVGPNSHPAENDWMSCQVRDGKWAGRGGPQKLESMVEAFVTWAEAHDS